MSWKQERDGLIAQTLAFVQSVTGKRDEPPASQTIAPPTPGTEAAAPSVGTTAPGGMSPNAAASKGVQQNLDTPIAARDLQPAMPPIARRPIVQSEMASEIRARIASFRAHQERFNREREEYFAATLARLRAAIKDTPPPPPPQVGK